MALAWTGNELVSLGGAVPGAGRPARDGYAFDPSAGQWSHIPPAPGPGRTDAYAVWTGSEVLLVGGYGDGEQQPANVALDPATNTWRRIASPPFPLATHAARVWTGHDADRLGRRPRTRRSGAEYVPATNRWHRIADAPITLTSPSAAWTGSRMIVFGSSIGASYDPHTNTWQRLPPSTLAPEASSVGWIGRRLVAWDYEGDTQVYSPSADRWSATSQNPFGFGECYPQSIATATSMFAWFCGKAAAVGPRAGSWALASGGVTAPTVHYGGIRLKQFQTASLAPAGAVIALAATGVVVNHGGPCFGCRGSPVRYWVYRAAARAVCRSVAADAPVRVIAPRGWATGTRASESATHDSATRSRSPQPGPDAQPSPGISRWMAGTWRSSTCRSISQATCRAGPFEGLERGAASRIWYLHITKHTRAPADVSVTVRFRRH